MGLSSLHCYLWSGELLPPLFTLTSGKPEAVIFCDTIRHAADRSVKRSPYGTNNLKSLMFSGISYALVSIATDAIKQSAVEPRRRPVAL